MKTVPLPGSLSALMVPFSSSTSFLLIESPSPVPSNIRLPQNPVVQGVKHPGHKLLRHTDSRITDNKPYESLPASTFPAVTHRRISPVPEYISVHCPANSVKSDSASDCHNNRTLPPPAQPKPEMSASALLPVPQSITFILRIASFKFISLLAIFIFPLSIFDMSRMSLISDSKKQTTFLSFPDN